MVKYNANICNMKFSYFEYKHEIHFYMRMEAIEKPKINVQNNKYLNSVVNQQIITGRTNSIFIYL